MSNPFDFPRLSTFVSGIVDRKIRAIALSITTSTSYLKSLITQASGYATQAHQDAQAASTSKSGADAAEASTLMVYSNFTSSYLGVQTADPQVSSLGNPVNLSAFYIRQTDGKVRYVESISSGVPVWRDITVAAAANTTDAEVIINTCKGSFLYLLQDENQDVQGLVNFKKFITVIQTTDWTQNNAVRASDVKAYVASFINPLTTNVSTNATTIQTEYDRAIAAENIIAGAIVTEHDRAMAAESDLSSRITSVSGFQNGFSNGSNNYGHWEIRPGVVEMWGVVNSPSTSEYVLTIHLPLQLNNTDYVISPTVVILNPGSYQDPMCQIIRTGKTTNSFTIQFQASNSSYQTSQGLEWRIISRDTPIPLASPPTGYNGTGPGGGGGGGGGTGGGGDDPQCPEIHEMVLLANTTHDGPGQEIQARYLSDTDWVWTRHENSGVWGAYKVVSVNLVDSEIWAAPGYPRTSSTHKWIRDDLSTFTMAEIGQFDCMGMVAVIEIEDAHTYIVGGKLSHNIKTQNAG